MKNFFIKKYWWLLLIIFLFALISQASVVIASYLITYSVDNLQLYIYSSSNQIYLDYFYIYLGSVLGGYVIYGIFTYINSILKEFYLQKVNTNLREVFISNLYDKNYQFIKVNNSSVVHNWINNDILNIYSKGTSTIFLLVELTMSLVFSFVALIFLFWGVALVVLFIAIASLLIPIVLNKKLQTMGNKFGKDNEEYFVKVYKNVVGIRNLFFLNRLDLIIHNLKESSTEFKKNKLDFIKKQYRILFFLILLSIIGQILTICLSAIFSVVKDVNGNTLMTPSALFSIAFLTGNIFGSFQQMFQEVMGFFAGKAIIKKNILPKEEYEYSIQDNLEELKFLKLENINLKYENKVVLDNLNFKFEKNKKYLIQGPSGCGKSSIAKILLGINNDYQGDSFYNNKQVKSINHKLINKHFSYVVNEGFIFDTSFANNITLFDQKVDNNKLTNLKNECNLDFIENFNDNVNLSKLSTGQTQRLNIARNLYEKKEIIIFDEALSNLDTDNSSKIEKLLLNKKDLTFINITHHINKENLRGYDFVLKVEKGKLKNV